MTQSDVDLLIFSATMTKKCFPKCVRNLPGHGTFLYELTWHWLFPNALKALYSIQTRSSACASAQTPTSRLRHSLRTCSSVLYFTMYQSFVHSKVLSSSDPMTTVTFKPKF